MNKKYTVFDHTADLGVEIYGRDEKELFSNAAHAIFDIMTDINAVYTKVERDIHVEGSGLEDLLVNFLREILYLFNGEGLSLHNFLVSEMDSYHIKGTIRGEFFDPNRHRLNMEVKAVTYHRTEVKKGSHGWTALVIFDV
ncbi:MAG: archease [Syntrophaceae bacterium]|nr:archease [Syntrophaceae bacterium]